MHEKSALKKNLIILYSAQISIWIYSDAPYKLQTHPTQPRGGHPSHSNLVRGKLTSPTPNPAGDGTSGLTSYPRRRSKVSEATCLRPQRSAPSRTRTRAVRPRVQRSDHWATHASQRKKKRVHACNFSKRTQKKPARERSSLVCMRQSFVLPLVQFLITEKIAF